MDSPFLKDIFEVLERLPEGDLEECAVVFTGRRPSYFMYDELKKKGVLFPPKVFTLSDFFSTMLTYIAPFYKASETDLIYYAKKASEPFISEFAQWEAFIPWAGQLIHALEELELNEVSVEDVGNVCSILTGYEEDELFFKLWNHINDIRHRFYDLLEKDRVFTYSMILNRCLSIEKVPFKHIIFAGLFAINKREHQLLLKLSDLTTTRFIFNAVDLPKVKEHIINISDSLGATISLRRPLPEKIEIVRSSGLYSQFLDLDKRLPDKVDGPTQVGIILPDPEALFPMADIICHGSRKFNITMGYPFSKTPMYQFLNSLFSFCEEYSDGIFPVKLFFPILRHPYIRNITYKDIDWANALSELERALSEAELGMAGFNDVIGLSEYKDVVESVRGLFIEPMISAKTLKQLAQVLKDMIAFIYDNNERFRQHKINREYMSLLKKACFDAVNSMLSDEAISLKMLLKTMRMFLLSNKIPFVGSPVRDMQIMGALEARNMAFENLFVLHMNEGIYPKTRSQNLILTDNICRFLKMPSSKDRELLFMYDFYSTLSMSKSAVLFYIESNKEKLEISRFIRQIDWMVKGRYRDEVELIYSNAEGIRLDLSERESVLRRAKPDSILSSINRFSATTIDTYIACPMKFYYRYIAKVKQPVSKEYSPERKDIGTIVHNALSILYRPFIGKELTEDAFKIMMQKTGKAVEESADGIFTLGRMKLVHTKLILQVIEARVKSFIQKDKKRWLKEGFRVYFIEDEQDEGFYAKLDIGGISLPFFGRADRIDILPDGTYLILDYKTSSRKAPDVRKRCFFSDDIEMELIYELYKRSVQLPLYAHLFAITKGIDTGKINAGFWNINEAEPSLLFTDKTIELKDSFMSLFKTDLVFIIQEILDKEKPFECHKDVMTCAYCPYKDICMG